MPAGAAAYLILSPQNGIRRALEAPGDYPVLEIRHPIAGADMPRNMPAPVVSWKTNAAGGEDWVVAFKTGGTGVSPLKLGQDTQAAPGGRTWWFEGVQPLWRPEERVWRQIKEAAGSGPIDVIVGAFGKGNHRPQARGTARFTLSRETVDNPLFYREVILPFAEAVKDPSQIRWRFGAIDRGTLPPVVLDKLPVCGNCHSFDRKGEYLAMDVDYANSKASYVITRSAPEMRLATSDIICRDDYRREDGQQTFGLLSQISPDGRYVVSTVKDRSVFVPRPNLAFSQLFFPLKGILVVYDRDAKEYRPLPGADDPAFVQSNPAWSLDGQWVVFARNRAIPAGSSSPPRNARNSSSGARSSNTNSGACLSTRAKAGRPNRCAAPRATGAAIISRSTRRKGGGSSFARPRTTCSYSRTANSTSSRRPGARPGGWAATWAA